MLQRLTIAHNGHDKICRRTSTLIEAIPIALIHLDAQPSFELSEKPAYRDAPVIDNPSPVAQWLWHTSGSSSNLVVLTFTNDKALYHPI